MNLKDCIEEFLIHFPEYKPYYLEHFNDYGEVLGHVFFGDCINIKLFELLKTNADIDSIGKPLDGDNRASYGIIDIQLESEPEFEIRRISYSISEVLYLAKERDFPYTEKYEVILSSGLL